MRAFIYKVKENGMDSLGTANSFITNEYRSLKNLLRYSFRNCKQGNYHLEIFYNWDNRYARADIDLFHKV